MHLKSFIKKILKIPSGSARTALEGKHSKGANLVVIGCKHNSKVTLYFTITKNAGSRRKGKLHGIKFSDSHINIQVRLVDQPSAASEFFDALNAVNKHEYTSMQIRFREKWEMRDPCFRLSTSVISIHPTNTLKLSVFHLLFLKWQAKCNSELSITVSTYAEILAKQLLQKAKVLLLLKIESRVSTNRKSIDLSCKDEVSSISEALVPEPRIEFYGITKNEKGKNCRKLRRCA